MAEAENLARRREIIADGDHSALRATWHKEAGFIVVSLWRGESCVASSHLTPREAAQLATFITSSLAEAAMAHHAESLTRRTATAPVSILSGLRHLLRRWRGNLAWSLESWARKLR